MKLGMVGLGKMGANMTVRLLRGGHQVVATDLAPVAVAEVVEEGAGGAEDLSALVAQLEPPRVLWLMLPAGGPTESVFSQALELLAPGDIVVDGANSNWQDSRERAERAEAQGIAFVDCGVSGGVWGLEEGYNLMVGASDEAFQALAPVLDTLTPPGGYAHIGPSGAGHFVKMIHNGVEYALMQAYGEGFEALAAYPYHDLDLEGIARLWTRGSVIRSWLLELSAAALGKDPRLEHIVGYVSDSGMGRWALQYGVEQAVPLPALAAALFARFSSRQEDSFAAKLAAALRNEFGGHLLQITPDADGNPLEEA